MTDCLHEVFIPGAVGVPGGWTCAEVRTEVARLLADDLAPAAARQVRAHLAACGHCFARVELARALRMVTRTRYTAARAPGALARKIRKDISGFTRQHGRTA